MCTSLNLSDLSTPLSQQMTVVHDYKASGKHELTCKKGKMSLYFTCREAYHILIHSKNIFFQYGNSCNIVPFFRSFCYWCWWFISLFFKEITLFSTVWKVVVYIYRRKNTNINTNKYKWNLLLLHAFNNYSLTECTNVSTFYPQEWWSINWRMPMNMDWHSDFIREPFHSIRKKSGFSP